MQRRSERQCNSRKTADRGASFDGARARLKPLAQAIALLAAGGMIGQAHAQQAFSPAWFANKGAAQSTAAATGRLPNGQPALPQYNPAQQQQARDRLQTSIGNLNLAARAIAAQQSAQAAARAAALAAGSTIPDGLGEGGLKVDTNSLTAGWHNAKGPTQTVADGKTTVTIEQTADKAILNWETFNVGRNTTVDFQQQSSWSALNRVNDPNARPSEIQGQIKADGTVLIVNRNGIVFDGSSQVNVRNLAAAAANITDAQFGKGLYSEAQGSNFIPTFANDLSTTASSFSHGAATGEVVVKQGARIATHVPTSVTEGGGYVLLAGGAVHNAGEIITTNGQTTLAAGDAFVIKKGLATDANQTSTTRGNVVSVLRLPDAGAPNPAGKVGNSGLIRAETGDISLVGHDVRQDGTLIATSSVHTRGTIHLSNAKTDTTGQVTLGKNSVSAIVLDDSATTALDVQREALIKDTDKEGDGVKHRRDQSLVQIVSGGTVDFEGDSLTLATGGQVLVDAVGTSTVQEKARIDVSGHVGVKIAMEANNVLINVQGNEQRDAPVNRDGDDLRNNDIWLDRRDLVLVPAGTNGYETDRWYTAGGLLEVGGYLGITGHGIGEWSAQGGTVQFSGAELITQQGSNINLSGGTLDVQTGHVYQTWLKGADGQLYNASTAPGDLLYTGLYKGFETAHTRWGSTVKQSFYNPLIAPLQRLENGYTVGRDAGKLVVSTQQATLQGDLDTTTFQGERQQRARDTALDGYQQAQTAVARNGQLIIGTHTPVYDKDTGNLRYSVGAVVDEVRIGHAAGGTPQAGHIALDAAWLDALGLGALEVYARGSLTVDEAISVSPGGTLALHASDVAVHADLTARGGNIRLGDMVVQYTSGGDPWQDRSIAGAAANGYTRQVAVGDNVTLDARGLWTNQMLDADISGLPLLNGGDVMVRSSGDVALGEGSLVDASAGAALHADGTRSGGKGGHVTLAAGMLALDASGNKQLVLEGEVRSHGVKGGGTLTLQTGQTVVIGGQMPGSDGTLPAGQSSLVDLVTTEAITIAAGAVLPSDFSYSRTHAKPGEAVGSAPVISVNDNRTWITLAADWTPPVPASGWYRLDLSDGTRPAIQAGGAPITIPAGTRITNLENGIGFPVDYVLPAHVFPAGVAVVATTTTLKAGSIAPNDLLFAAGSIIKAGTALDRTVSVQPMLLLETDHFRRGFSHYDVSGGGGVAVAEGAKIDVSMPVLRIDPTRATDVATGADPADALQLWEPPLFLEDPVRRQMTQRGGASLALSAGNINRASPLILGEGADITVDAGQSITLTGNAQITLEGTLRAHGGRITVLGGNFGTGANANIPAGIANPRSLWVGETAVLDVSGIARTGVDALGNHFGQVLDGGVIELGARHNLMANSAGAIDAFLVVKEGALLDASGASGTIYVPGQGDTVLASHGGSIALASSNGLFVDGELRAAAGGAGAMGGALALMLETPAYVGLDDRYTMKGDAVSDAVRVPRELIIEQVYGGSGLDGSVQVGQLHDTLAYGKARYGVDAIHAGGFDTTALLVNGLLSFDGNIDLRMNQALYLTASALGLSTAAARDSEMHLAAPYLRLAGSGGRQGDFRLMPNPVFGSNNTSAAGGTLGVPRVADAARLLLAASHVDIVGETGFGAAGTINLNAPAPLEVRRDAFGSVRIESQGDIRLMGANLYSPGNTTLAAGQIHGTGAVTVGLATINPGLPNPRRGYDATRRLDIERIGTALPPMPYSVFGEMEFNAATINQGGVLRAPLGNITLGDTGNDGNTGIVNLLPGSITSVSANGLAIPYGGTLDGLTYNYNGKELQYQGIGYEPTILFEGHAVNAMEGAVVDLSGGGELTGAAFLPGRGGSTDARFHPLVQMGADGFILPALSANPVYAIVPGVQAGYAPVGGEAGASAPAIGRQITIGEGVPGLSAGTYTLLPSTYALLPGAFRVELNGQAGSSAAFGATSGMRNGSWSTSVRLGIANTGVTDVMPTQAILTAADTLRAYSQYNETSYAEFGLRQAAREGVPAPLLERDAKALHLGLVGPGAPGSLGLPALTFDAQTLTAPAEGGHGAVLRVSNNETRNIEILADGAAPTAGFDGLSLHADMLNNIGVARMEIGGSLRSTYTDTDSGLLLRANVIGASAGNTRSIVLRSGAVLEASDVFLITGRTDGGITLEQGAGIDTLGRGSSGYGAEQGYIYQPGRTSVLAVSNSQLDLLAPEAPATTDPLVGAGAIEIGVCTVGSACSGDTRLYSEGSISIATDNRFVLGDTVRYGTRNLSLALGAINVGSAAALEAAALRGVLPPGMTLNQQVVDRLLLGDTSTGAPALESLSFTARESVNFFGDVTLSTYGADGKSALQRLVLGTPAIYGYGESDAVARIHTDTLIWTGARTPAGGIIADGPGTGSGRLVVDAREIVFGYGPKTQPDTVHDHDRVALGFGSVHLNASERVTATHKGSLAVYASQGAWNDATKHFDRTGGDLFIQTSLLTGGAGSVNKITAGGDIHVSGTGTPAPDNAALIGALGAELSLDSRGGDLVLDTAVLLPSGKLGLAAHGDVSLQDGAQLDLAGRKIEFFDASKYSWGGDVLIDSRTGGVQQSAGSRIDLSAEHNRAGKLGVAAAQGVVSLAGRIDGSSTGHYDAGGTKVPYLEGRIDVYGRGIADFAGLNTRLTEGGVVGGRSFRIGHGDLAIGDEVKAHEVNVSLDDGHLTVNGTIDASGEQAGGIRLAAKDGVTLAGTAVLDTRASVLRVDSYGKPIEAPNRAVIEIDSGRGTLAIASGAALRLEVAGAPTSYGTVALNAPRLGGNDVDIDAAGTVNITGAKAIHVNAFITDDTAAVGMGSTTDGKTYQIIDQDYLDRLDGDSRTFINAALANGALMNGKLAGLRVYADQFHLRPGVEVVADTTINPDGNLHVDGDIDLSGHRYASVNPHTQQRTGVHGSGEAGALVIRAAGDLDVFGSISDGFDGSRLQPSFDSEGWVLTKGRQHWASDVVVPRDGMVTLDAGTVFNSGKVLNYDLPINAMQMAAGTLLPANASLAQPLSLARGTVLSAAVHDANGNLLYAAGSVLADAVTLPADTQLAAGFRLPGQARIAAMVWPAGVALPAPPVGNNVVLASALALNKGALIPSDTDIKLPGGVDMVDLRPRDADGHQGRIWALAPMLAPGSQSFDVTLVAGADTGAADRLATLREGRGSLRFSDMHYGRGGTLSAVPGTGSPATFKWGDLQQLEQLVIDFWGEYVLSFVPVTGEPITPEQSAELQAVLFFGGTPDEINSYGYGELVAIDVPATPPDMEFSLASSVREQLPSVVRTGTGDLRLVSAQDIATSSLYGIYTAGTASASLADAGGPDPYNQPRSVYKGSVLDEAGVAFESLVDGGSDSLYQAWYPEAGGNLLLRAGGDISGDTIGRMSPFLRNDAMGYRVERLNGTDSVGNWLWRQGTGSVAGEGDTAVPTAWWINFGTYVPSNLKSYYASAAIMPRFTGFTGFGTLGGGNLVLEAGGDAGMLQARGDHGGYYIHRSSGLNLAVASTGRVTAAGELVQTGGGDLDIRIGGGLNSDPALNAFSGINFDPVFNPLAVGNVDRLDLNGSFTNLRGALRLQAGAVGSISLSYGGTDPRESRPLDVFSAQAARAAGGPVLVLGDAGARIESRGDLVLGTAVDAGRVPQYHGGTPFEVNGKSYAGNGWSWFSLWTPATAIDLLAAGGHLTPTLGMNDTGERYDGTATDGNFIYPSVLRAAAANGNIYYGELRYFEGTAENNERFQPSVTLAPSPVADQFVTTGHGQLELLARGSIYTQGAGFYASGADPTALPDPLRPGFVGRGDPVWFGLSVIHNVNPNALVAGPMLQGGLDGPLLQNYPLFTFTPPTASGHVFVGQAPARYYAVEGDLMGLRLGSIIHRGGVGGQPGRYASWYDGGGAVAIRAGRDIVNAGTALGWFESSGASGWITVAHGLDPSAPHKIEEMAAGTRLGNLIVHTSADDVSVIEAGRDVRYSTFKIAGPGLLDVSAGRDVYMGAKAELRSIGPVVDVTPGDRASGAGIAVSVGMGSHGADWAAFADRYLDPANQADPERPLADQPGKAVRTYGGSITLGQWLAREFGYGGDEAGAQDFLGAQQQQLDTARAAALARGDTAANRSLAREYKLEAQLHLVNWLTQRFGGANGRGLHFDAATMDARTFFDALPSEQRSAFLRGVYYAELKAAGREYNDVDGPRQGSYLRGREAIATLLPSHDADGQAIDYEGDLTMFSAARYFLQVIDTRGTWRPQPGVDYISEAEWIALGSPAYDTPFYKVHDAGIHTDFGGDINLLAPGGRTLIGVDGGYSPGAGSGVLTQGEGDINIFSLDDILMGQSRIFTTFGGNILAWSAEGDINAGRGAKTTVVYTPQRRVYDDIGNVSLSPNTPNTGAGIATLNPIPEVPPGDIDLIAPLGTIDAGEAGIRVSGNVNLAALQVVNAENIQVQGEATGIPVVAAVNVGALTDASAAASSAAAAASDMVQRDRAGARKNLPSVFTVRVLGFGEDSGRRAPDRRGAGLQRSGYDRNGVVQVLGAGALSEAEQQPLTLAERRELAP